MWLISILTLLQHSARWAVLLSCPGIAFIIFPCFSIHDRVFVSEPPPHTHTHSWILLLSPRLSSSCSCERQEDIDQGEMAQPDNKTPKEIGERIQEPDQQEKRFRGEGREGFPLTCFANSFWLVSSLCGL